MGCDITGYSRRPYNIARAILERGNGDGDSQDDAVLAHPLRLIVVNALSLANMLHDLRKFIFSIWCKEYRDWLTYDFLSAVPIHALRRCIPASDNAIQIFTNNGIIRRFYNSSQVKKSLLCTCLTPIQAWCQLLSGNIAKIANNSSYRWHI